MIYTTLISTGELAPYLDDPTWAIVDCRYTLGDGERGRRDYLQAHIPGAVYAHLDEDLSDPHIPGLTGRHPLPPVARLAERFSAWGIDRSVQVVAYDDWPEIGLATAARLWWLLRWLGQEAVAVLDGGWRHWLAAGLPIRPGEVKREPRSFQPALQTELLAGTEEVERMCQDPGARLMDARSADRYRGENEIIDPVAGHIPGAISAPFAENTSPEGLFLSQDELRKRFEALLNGVPARAAVFYCGSGVTAAVNNLALAHAGLGDAKLYAGSWSEWITDLRRPVEKGPG